MVSHDLLNVAAGGGVYCTTTSSRGIALVGDGEIR
jgi:hypothetical protein